MVTEDFSSVPHGGVVTLHVFLFSVISENHSVKRYKTCCKETHPSGHDGLAGTELAFLNELEVDEICEMAILRNWAAGSEGP